MAKDKNKQEQERLAAIEENKNRRKVSRKSGTAEGGGDEDFLGSLSAAELALSPGGFSGVSVDPAERREIVRYAMDRRVPGYFAPDQRERLQARVDALGTKLSEREKEQAEYSGMMGTRMAGLGGEDPSTWVSAGRADAKAAEERKAAIEGNKAAADKELQRSGITPQDFWAAESGLPEGAVKREVTSESGELVSQIAGPQGFASVRTSPEGAALIAKQREAAEDRAIKFQNALAANREQRVQRDKEQGVENALRFAQWDQDKRDLAEGTQRQSEATRRISRINRALREDAAFQQRWERGQGYATPMSAEQYNALLDERDALKGVVARRETLREKGVTDLGRQARNKRAQRAVQAAELQKANQNRIAAAGFGTSAAQNIMSTGNPYLDMMRSLTSSLLPNFSQLATGFGFGSPTTESK